MKKSINLISIEQPIGIFYIGKISSCDLLNIYYVQARTIYHDGIQRDRNEQRTKKISEYINDPDATFPTPIIIAVDSKDIDVEHIGSDLYKFSYEDSKTRFAEIIDGQHRVEGLKNNPHRIIELPVVVMLDLTKEEKAYVFSVINSNQKQVSKSYIYDLFELYTGRSVVKTCHNIVRALNSSKRSPFNGRVKMLGKKNIDTEVISQGTFVDALIRLITNDYKQDDILLKNNCKLKPNNNYIFRDLFIDGKDEIIYRILLNYFTAISNIFYEEWNDVEHYNMLKTTGIAAFCKALPVAFRLGVRQGKLDVEFFEGLMKKTKKYMDESNIKISSKQYASGESEQNKLRDDIVKEWLNE